VRAATRADVSRVLANANQRFVFERKRTPAANALKPRAKQQVLIFHHANLIFTRTPKLPVAHLAFCLLGNDVRNGELHHPQSITATGQRQLFCD